MSNEERKFNKVQKLFIKLTGCNPEKDVFEISENFKRAWELGGAYSAISSIAESRDLSHDEWKYFDKMIGRLEVMVEQGASVKAVFRDCQWLDYNKKEATSND